MLASMIGGAIGVPLYAVALVVATVLAFVFVYIVDGVVSQIIDLSTGIYVCQMMAIPITVTMAAPVFGAMVSFAQMWFMLGQPKAIPNHSLSYGWVVKNMFIWAVIALAASVVSGERAMNFGCGILD
jgi:hypothetical protein